MSPSRWFDQLNAIAPIFADAALRGAIVLLAALVLTHLMRRRSAAARHLVWVGAIVVQLLLPLFAVWGPRWDVAISSRVASILPVDLPTTGITVAPFTGPPAASAGQATTQIPSVQRAVQTTLPSPNAPVVTGRTLLLALWALGALVVLARLAVGTSMVATLARKGARVDDGGWLALAQRVSTSLEIDRPLTLLRGDKLGVPVTWGIVYPVVLLPDDADSWPEERRRLVLVHEMAHVKRLDALTQLAGQLALALFWFNPLVWIANRRMQLEREHACDDYVLRHGTAPSKYAEELLSMVRSLDAPDHRTAQPAFAALAMARRSEFEGRMLSILDPVLDRHPLSKGRTLMSAFAALLLVVPLAALHPYKTAAAAAQEPMPIERQITPTTKGKTTDGSPDSFKVSNLPSMPVLGAFDSARRTFATGMKALNEPLQAMGGEIVTISGKTPSCDRIRFTGSGTSMSTHIHSDDDSDGSAVIDFTKYNGERCSSASLMGRIKYSANEDAIVDMAFGAHATFRERTTTEDRELSVSRGPDGTLQYAFRHNGSQADYDESARRWFASYLPTVLMETGINVGPRVAMWRAQGGVDGVLDHIKTMSSSGAKRSHYEALLDGDKLSGDELDRVVRSASETLRGSSGDMRSVLTKAIPNARISRQAVPALESAIIAMGSSGDKTAVLQIYGQSADREMLLSVMRVAPSIGSSGDRARLLQILAPRYLAKPDRALVDAYFSVADGIPSSGDKQKTLMIAMPYASQSPDIARHVIQSARGVPSPGDRSQVLIALVNTNALSTKELRDAFFDAAAEVPSQGDRARVLSAAATIPRQ